MITSLRKKKRMDMKKNNKGFTLIELLVVVAIIGILAAVGTVAYTGYTANAKKSAAKSNHASVVKYVAAELQKCNMDEDNAMDDNLVCDDKSTTAKVQAAAKEALSDFKNPYKTGSAAIVNAVTAGEEVGFVLVVDDGSDVTVTTCFAETDNDVADAALACHSGDSKSTVENTIAIE